MIIDDNSSPQYCGQPNSKISKLNYPQNHHFYGCKLQTIPKRELHGRRPSLTTASLQTEAVLHVLARSARRNADEKYLQDGFDPWNMQEMDW